MIPLGPRGRSGVAPRRPARTYARSATGGTTVSGANRSSTSAGTARRRESGTARLGATSMIRRAPLAAVADDVVGGGARGTIGRQRHDHRPGADDRRRPGRHLPGLRSLRVDERHLLELERRLESGRVREAPADDEEVLRSRRSRRRSTRRPARRRRSPFGVVGRQTETAATASGRSSPSIAPSTRIVADRVDENVFVITGAPLGPPAERTTWSARRVRLEPGTWTIPTVGTRAADLLEDAEDVAELTGCRDADDRVTPVQPRAEGPEVAGRDRDRDRVARPARRRARPAAWRLE